MALRKRFVESVAGMRIGLTGGIGCGKSTVARMMAERGLRTIDSDAIVRDLLTNDGEVITAVRSRFGDAAVGEDGVDRRHLAGVVFRDTEALSWLEQLLHPRVRTVWTAYVDADPDRSAVVEIPLLFEKNLENSFNITVAVASGRDQQHSRLRDKGISEEDASARIARQMPLEQKIARADYVILNTGSLSFLSDQVELLLDRLN